MLSEFFRHFRYFLPRLLGFGFVLGALFGALTYPILGLIVGAPWGLVGGLLVAGLLSAFIPIYEHRFAPEDESAKQSQMVLMAGLVTTIVMAIPLLVLYAPIAGLTAAYLMQGYTDSPEYTGEKRKSSSQDPYQRRAGVLTKVASETMSAGKWIVFLGTAVGALLTFVMAFGISSLSLAELIPAALALLTFGIFGLMYGFLVSIPIALVNGLFVNFMNRLYFTEDTPKAVYKARIVAMLSLLTLFTSAIVTGVIGAPFASIAAGLAAAKYADWYYEEAEKPKRATRLEDNLEEDESLEADEFAEENESSQSK